MQRVGTWTPALQQKHGRAGHAALRQKCFPELDCKFILCGNISKCFWYDWPAGTALASAIAWLAVASVWQRAPRSPFQLPFTGEWCGYSSRHRFGLESSGMARGGCELGSECIYLLPDTGKGLPQDLRLVTAGSSWTSGFQYT